jgi:phage baseplate assembly protein W
MDKSINFAFPLQDDTDNNRYLKMNQLTKDAIKSDLFLLLLTNKGERWYNPNYGSDLRRFLFDPNDEISEMDIKESLRNTVETYMPNITVEGIDITENHTNKITLLIGFTYTEDFFSFQDTISVSFSN